MVPSKYLYIFSDSQPSPDPHYFGFVPNCAHAHNERAIKTEGKVTLPPTNKGLFFQPMQLIKKPSTPYPEAFWDTRKTTLISLEKIKQLKPIGIMNLEAYYEKNSRTFGFSTTRERENDLTIYKLNETEAQSNAWDLINTALTVYHMKNAYVRTNVGLVHQDFVTKGGPFKEIPPPSDDL